jgi:group I intron endonuclease
MPTSDPTTSGIYQIRCLVNGRVYVGSAVNIRQRWNGHRSDLSRGRHRSPRLQNAWRKYGPEQFVFEVLETVPDQTDLIRVEQQWIDRLRPFDRARGYNICATAGSCPGLKHTPETRAKMAESIKRQWTPEKRARKAEAMKGLTLDAETKAKVSAAAQRRWADPDQRAKRSQAMKTRMADPATRAKLAEARRRWKLTPEGRARISAANQSRTPELLAKIAATKKGRKLTPEHRAKIAAAGMGRRHTPATRAKMAASAREREAAKRARRGPRPAGRQAVFSFPE